MLSRLIAFALLLTAAPAAAQDAADFVVRLNRLENQVRQMSGHIEQLQFENRQLKDQVRKFQEDVEFRFQDSSGPRGTARAAPPPASPPAASVQAPAPLPPPQAGRPQRRGDAFDPASAPNAPGAPMPLGTTPPSTPLPPGAVAGATPGPGPLPRGAIDARGPAEGPTIGSLIEDDDDDGPPRGGAPLDLGATGRVAAAPPPARPAPSVAATGTGDARMDYDAAYAYILQRQYEQAEMGLRQFIQSHPRDRLVPDAVYWLGETYLQRNRPREAAEQFLKVSTEHARAAKAPDAMLKLGISLNALGAREQACATFAELGRKYPEASGSVRQGVEREQKRARCT
ncbi:MAG TPA: tol-pal system protein YbgF [Beijerinckiaceae bacterium]|jgi:tol-pal system protein YbgF